METNKPRIFIISMLLGLTTLASTQNAFSAPGKVSRSCAPFGAQESVTVDWTFQPHSLWTASQHFKNGSFLHTINTTSNSSSTGGWEYTWRSYAGHFGTEFWYGAVIGHHYKRNGLVSFLGNTSATDCNLSEWGTG
ncbi:MAG: hypothetical protein KZQ99_22165 [Candidatus Thiodiazotropha sp. (ex Dulcina madagascariensis)]|nr:hypothetical protein [Candidatus Thiodiazotropha sp. (ex Dulcina madagascariensis)]